MSDRNDLDAEDDDDHGMLWEDEADSALQHALETAITDDVRGSVSLPSDDDHGFGTECTSIEELAEKLAEIYDEMWYANVPFDEGEAVFRSDAQGATWDALAGTELEDFFVQISEPQDASRIITSHELIRGVDESKILQVEFVDIEKELVEYFAKNPDRVRELHSFAFEKLMAAVYRNRGFDVTMTPRSKDGGFDLILLQRNDIGAAMTLVDCKRYAAHKKVGVEIVRGLYGTVEEKKATHGVIVTTSSFTSGAVALRDKLKYRMELTDFNTVKRFLKEWRSKPL
jgi:HJR/Mrr/RecB family endonuclease